MKVVLNASTLAGVRLATWEGEHNRPDRGTIKPVEEGVAEEYDPDNRFTYYSPHVGAVTEAEAEAGSWWWLDAMLNNNYDGVQWKPAPPWDTDIPPLDEGELA